MGERLFLLDLKKFIIMKFLTVNIFETVCLFLMVGLMLSLSYFCLGAIHFVYFEAYVTYRLTRYNP